MLLAAPLVSHAQTAGRTGGPVSGTWAGEASTGGLNSGAEQSAALLRFMSPQTALVGAFGFARIESSGSGSFGTSTLTSSALQVGVRRYTRTGLGLRPVYGAGLLVRTSDFSSGAGSNSTSVGGYGEAGAVWFFNPHVSLGVLGGLSVLNGDGSWTIGGSLARLNAAVYF
jgi:hypothetical protein